MKSKKTILIIILIIVVLVISCYCIKLLRDKNEPAQNQITSTDIPTITPTIAPTFVPVDSEWTEPIL